MKLSVIILSYNTAAETLACLKSVFAGAVPDQETIVVDQASSDDSVAQIKQQFPRVTLIESHKNVGFAKGCNMGAAQAKGRYLAFINSDCLLEPAALPALVKYLDQDPGISVAVPRLLHVNGQVQPNIARLPTLSNIFSEYIRGRVSAWYEASKLKVPTAVESFSGAAFVIRRADFETAGRFHEDYFMYVEDVELSWQLHRLGKSVVYIPTAIITHTGGGSSHRERKSLDKMREAHRLDYVRRHFPPLQARVATWVIQVGVGIMKIKNYVKQVIPSHS